MQTNIHGRQLDVAPALRETPLAAALLALQPRGAWVFTDRPVYAFHAGSLIPPEMAVLSKKRFWTGQVSEDSVVSCLRHYRPGFVLLAGPLRQDYKFRQGRTAQRVDIGDGTLARCLSAQYKEAFRDPTGSLYVLKRLETTTPRTAFGTFPTKPTNSSAVKF